MYGVSIIHPHFAFIGDLKVFFVSEKSPIRQATTGPTPRLLCQNPLGWYPNPSSSQGKTPLSKDRGAGLGPGRIYDWRFCGILLAVLGWWFCSFFGCPQFIQSDNLSIPNMQTKPRIKHRPDNWESIIMSTTAVDQQNHLVIPTYTRFFHW